MAPSEINFLGGLIKETKVNILTSLSLATFTIKYRRKNHLNASKFSLILDFIIKFLKTLLNRISLSIFKQFLKKR